LKLFLRDNAFVAFLFLEKTMIQKKYVIPLFALLLLTFSVSFAVDDIETRTNQFDARPYSLSTLQSGEGHGGLHELKNDPVYQGLTAVNEKKLFLFSLLLLFWFWLCLPAYLLVQFKSVLLML